MEQEIKRVIDDLETKAEQAQSQSKQFAEVGATDDAVYQDGMQAALHYALAVLRQVLPNG